MVSEYERLLRAFGTPDDLVHRLVLGNEIQRLQNRELPQYGQRQDDDQEH